MLKFEPNNLKLWNYENSQSSKLFHPHQIRNLNQIIQRFVPGTHKYSELIKKNHKKHQK